MLILGAHVLVGFDFQAAFQPGFDRLPPEAQRLKIVGLGLMLIAIALLLAPTAFHRIVESGKDTVRLIDFTGRIASCALLPFAIGIGIEVYIATVAASGEVAAPWLGLSGAAFALFFWYGLDWIWRARDQALGAKDKERPMEEPTPLETRIRQVLTEARVVLPGVQALLGFQLAAMLTDAFGKLPRSSQYVHVVSLGLLAMSIVFLMAPAAFHRIVERGEDTERLHGFSSAMILAALVPLALGIAGDFYIVLNKVLDAPGMSIGLAAASLVFSFGMWFGVTLVIRSRKEQKRPTLRVSRVTR